MRDNIYGSIAMDTSRNRCEGDDDPKPWDGVRCEHCGESITGPDDVSYSIDEDRYWCYETDCQQAYRDEFEAEYEQE